MKRSGIIISTILLIVTSLYAQQTKPLILTSTQDIASITRAIGGDIVRVEPVMEGKDHPFYFVPSRRMELLGSQAEAYLHTGLGLESNWQQSYLNAASNPELKEGSEVIISVCDGITMIPMTPEDPQAKPLMYGDRNPFVWLDPENGKIMIRTIYTILSELYPDAKPEFNKNRNRYVSDFDNKNKVWHEKMEQYKGLKVVAYDHSFDYFARAFGLDIVAYIEPAAGVPPSKARVQSIIERVESENIPLLFVPDYISLRIPNQIAEKTGITVLPLPTSAGTEWATEYIQLFDYIVNNIHSALSGHTFR